MVFSIVKALCTAALLACASSAVPQVQAFGSPDPLCSLPPGTIIKAAQKYPMLAPAVKELEKHSSAIWYTDNEVAATMQSRINQMLSHCPDNSRLTLVVYGLPNKDCEAGFSNVGSNKNATDYKNFIQTLADLVGNRKVLYVVEPDAVGLVANGGCAAKHGYTDNIHTALQILSQNENADIYLDVGYWTLLGEASAIRIANAVKTLSTAGKLKGIALNSGHFRPTADMVRLCTTFQKAYNSTSLNCVIDTSRNNNNNPTSSEWCNARFGGIGRPPTSNTGISNIDYLIWIKPVGESDGTCDSADLTPDAMRGPPAGQFFLEGFISLWNNGYYVQEKGFPALAPFSTFVQVKDIPALAPNSTYVQVKDIPALALNSTGREHDPRRVDVELVHEDHTSAGRTSGCGECAALENPTVGHHSLGWMGPPRDIAAADALRMDVSAGEQQPAALGRAGVVWRSTKVAPTCSSAGPPTCLPAYCNPASAGGASARYPALGKRPPAPRTEAALQQAGGQAGRQTEEELVATLGAGSY